LASKSKGIVKLDTYQELAERTSMWAGKAREDRLVYAEVALAGEVGELLNYSKKGLWHGHEMRQDLMVEELGDIMWYIAEIASCLQVPLSDVATTNIDKLNVRYEDGFTSDASINRER